MTDVEASRVFIDLTRRWLLEEYPSKLRFALDRLPESELWWRPNAASNSIGNLVLHLAGNARQWVVAGVGGEEDVRDRAGEFAAENGSIADVLGVLSAALREVDGVLGRLDPGALTESRVIQGLEVTVQEALYHVVEHFSMHVGQILWIVKARTGSDLGFYEVDDRGAVTGTRW